MGLDCCWNHYWLYNHKIGLTTINHITNKVRLCERSEPQSEPFVEQARSRQLVIENIFLKVCLIQAGMTVCYWLVDLVLSEVLFFKSEAGFSGDNWCLLRISIHCRLKYICLNRPKCMHMMHIFWTVLSGIKHRY